MKQKLKPSNLAAQLHYRGEGNPASVLPSSAISNCFPGLEFDFRNLWRRTFEGIVLLESNNYVVDTEEAFADLKGRRLLCVAGKPTMVVTTGPQSPGGNSLTLNTGGNPNAVSFMEWSNSLAAIIYNNQGQTVRCLFSEERPAVDEILFDPKHPEKTKTIAVDLKIRHFFDGNSAALAEDLLQPGELTQGLCAPWQNDYRECACYYWAASRPDYVNVEAGPDGASHGDNWMAKKRSGQYVPDNREDTRLWSYDELFENWAKELKFIIRGRNADQS